MSWLIELCLSLFFRSGFWCLLSGSHRVDHWEDASHGVSVFHLSALDPSVDCFFLGQVDHCVVASGSSFGLAAFCVLCWANQVNLRLLSQVLRASCQSSQRCCDY